MVINEELQKALVNRVHQTVTWPMLGKGRQWNQTIEAHALLYDVLNAIDWASHVVWKLGNVILFFSSNGHIPNIVIE